MTKFGVVPWVFEYWKRFAYLIINGDLKLGELIQIKPDERFNQVVTDSLNAYLKEGVMPPREISNAILNMADDHMAGRTITIRAGDYIALQNFMRK